MIRPSETGRIVQGRNVTRHCDVKAIVAFSRGEDLDHNFARTGESAHPLALPQFMPPELSEICIDRRARFLPIYEYDWIARATIDGTDDGGLQCRRIGRG
jgi:hypothetical protein